MLSTAVVSLSTVTACISTGISCSPTEYLGSFENGQGSLDAAPGAVRRRCRVVPESGVPFAPLADNGLRDLACVATHARETVRAGSLTKTKLGARLEDIHCTHSGALVSVNRFHRRTRVRQDIPP